MPAHRSDRLETVLHAWEDLWYLAGVAERIRQADGQPPLYKHEKAIVNWSQLRKTILKTSIRRPQSLDMTHFMSPALNEASSNLTGEAAQPLELMLLPTMGTAIAGWCLQSRRIYYLSPDLMALLNATSLDRVRWKDVSLPFASFAISLGKPIVDPAGDVFDYILVTSLQDTTTESLFLDFRFFVAGCDQYTPLNEANKHNIEQRMRQRNWPHVAKLINLFLDNTEKVCGSRFELDATSQEEPVTTTAERLYSEFNNDFPLLQEDPRFVWGSMIRIVVGLCLYMQTLPAKSSYQSEWRKLQRSGLPDPRAITNEAEVCTVSSCYNLTREEKVFLGLEGDEQERKQYELSCHFRQGHWRRVPGTGHDPTAPKIVHVRPTIVRKDRLRENELPGGSEALV